MSTNEVTPNDPKDQASRPCKADELRDGINEIARQVGEQKGSIEQNSAAIRDQSAAISQNSEAVQRVADGLNQSNQEIASLAGRIGSLEDLDRKIIQDLVALQLPEALASLSQMRQDLSGVVNDIKGIALEQSKQREDITTIFGFIKSVPAELDQRFTPVADGLSSLSTAVTTGAGEITESISELDGKVAGRFDLVDTGIVAVHQNTQQIISQGDAVLAKADQVIGQADTIANQLKEAGESLAEHRVAYQADMDAVYRVLPHFQRLIKKLPARTATAIEKPFKTLYEHYEKLGEIVETNAEVVQAKLDHANNLMDNLEPATTALNQSAGQIRAATLSLATTVNETTTAVQATLFESATNIVSGHIAAVKTQFANLEIVEAVNSLTKAMEKAEESSSQFGAFVAVVNAVERKISGLISARDAASNAVQLSIDNAIDSLGGLITNLNEDVKKAYAELNKMEDKYQSVSGLSQVLATDAGMKLVEIFTPKIDGVLAKYENTLSEEFVEKISDKVVEKIVGGASKSVDLP